MKKIGIGNLTEEFKLKPIETAVFKFEPAMFEFEPVKPAAPQFEPERSLSRSLRCIIESRDLRLFNEKSKKEKIEGIIEGLKKLRDELIGQSVEEKIHKSFDEDLEWAINRIEYYENKNLTEEDEKEDEEENRELFECKKRIRNKRLIIRILNSSITHRINTLVREKTKQEKEEEVRVREEKISIKEVYHAREKSFNLDIIEREKTAFENQRDFIYDQMLFMVWLFKVKGCMQLCAFKFKNYGQERTFSINDRISISNCDGVGCCKIYYEAGKEEGEKIKFRLLGPEFNNRLRCCL